MVKQQNTANVVDLSEIVQNQKEGFGWLDEYIPCRIVDGDATHIGLFTRDELMKGIERSEQNPETAGQVSTKKPGFLRRLLG